jgi:ribosomal protein S18 acetylase RimI-like enzyme
VAWVIYDAEEAAGYLVACFGFALEYAGRDAFIDEFYVRPEYRESGIGSSALSQAERQLAGMGVKAMYLLVMPGNDRAEQFYRRAGYDDTGRLLLSKGLGEGE